MESTELTHIRRIFTETATTGEILKPDGSRLCYTVEDKYRGQDLSGDKKVYGKTCIPCGRYQLKLTYSPHFGKNMWLVDSVPFFQGVRIHAGNTAADSEGCLIVGRKLGVNRVDESVLALQDVTAYLASLSGPIFLTIKNAS